MNTAENLPIMSNVLNMGNGNARLLPRNSEQILHNAVKKTKMRAEWGMINAIWPDAYEVTHNLATYLMDIPRAPNGEPLIDVCILQALRTVKVLNKNRPDDNVSKHFISGYIAALLDKTPEVTRQIIGVETEERRYLWDPSHETMHQFILRMGEEPKILDKRMKPMTPRLVKTMVLSRIADGLTMNFISRNLDQEAL